MPEQAMRQFVFEPSYTRPDRGLSVLRVADIPLPEGFQAGAPPHLIQIEPEGWGGNHQHQRREAWVGFGDLFIVWRNEAGKRQEARMTRDDGKLQAFAVAPQVPHLIENRGLRPALLYEIMDVDDGPAVPLEGDQSLRAEL